MVFEADRAIVSGWSLALIGNASGQSLGLEQNLDPRLGNLRDRFVAGPIRESRRPADVNAGTISTRA
jgi:hypothetical protein